MKAFASTAGWLAIVGVGTTLAPLTAMAQPVPAASGASIEDTALSPEKFAFARTGNGAAGEWRVVDDPTAANGKALAQLSRDATDYRFPLAVYRPTTARNLDVAIRFKPVDGRIDRAGGVAVRLSGPDDYYVVRANALEDNVRLYRLVKGRREQIAGADTKVASGVWHTLRLRAEGSRFTVTFDGTQLFTADDKTFADGGQVALWTKADSLTLFDRIDLTVLP